MDIQRTGSKPVEISSDRRTGNVGVASSNTGRVGGISPTAGDTVNVSLDGQLLNVARNVAHSANDVRLAKIEQIRQQMDAGTYIVDSRRIAEGILREDANLFGISG